jgi:hypothetical protein
MLEAKEDLIEVLHGAANASETLAKTAADILTRSLRQAQRSGSEPLTVGSSATRGTVHGLAAVGLDIGELAPLLMSGVLRGARQGGGLLLETVHTYAAVIVDAAGEVGGNPAEAARGAVEGAVDTAYELGFTPEEAGAAAVAGALEAAESLGASWIVRVRDAMTESHSGLGFVLQDPFHSVEA